MPAPRKPTHLHVISGSAAKHPDRMRNRTAEPVFDGPDLRDLAPPEHLDEALRQIWAEVAPCLHTRVATEADRLALEALVRLVATMRSGDATAAHMGRLKAFLNEFGMTPASRSKVAQGAMPTRRSGFAALKDPAR